ncbi:MAG: hypothetical protein ABI416_08535 [Ginsengibacter sp.]
MMKACTSVYIKNKGSMQAQQTTPQILKVPGGWTFERFALPPDFAPSFSYNGVEELRFSPGMFNKDSIDYFTYPFAAQPDSTATFSQDNVRNYLLDYFKGLCSATAHDRKLVIDTTEITVSIEKKNGTPGNDIFIAQLNLFGVFADGLPVKLNMEIKVLMNARVKKNYCSLLLHRMKRQMLLGKTL